MKSKYAPLAYAARALRLLPYVSFDQEGEAKCVGKVYAYTWFKAAKEDPICKGKYKEDGWFLLKENEKDLPTMEMIKLKCLIRETREFMAKKSMELFPPTDGAEDYHIDEFKKKGWIQDQDTVYGRDFIPNFDD